MSNGTANGKSATSYLRPDVVAMKAYTPGEQVNECIKLNTNECAWGPAPGVLFSCGVHLHMTARHLARAYQLGRAALARCCGGRPRVGLP